MTDAEIDSFVQEVRHAIVGTNTAHGAPQLSPVWYVYDEGRIYISITIDTAKYYNLKRDPRVSVCVDGGYPDSRAVIFYGVAKLVERDDPLVPDMRWRIIRRYHQSDEEARRYVESTQGQKTALIVVTPEKIISQDFN